MKGNYRGTNPAPEALMELSQYMETKGVGFYIWQPHDKNDDFKKAVERGEFQNGIPLRRVRATPLWLERARMIESSE